MGAGWSGDDHADCRARPGRRAGHSSVANPDAARDADAAPHNRANGDEDDRSNRDAHEGANPEANSEANPYPRADSSAAGDPAGAACHG